MTLTNKDLDLISKQLSTVSDAYVVTLSFANPDVHIWTYEILKT